MIAGIYKIENKINGRVYIGHSKDMWDRINGHIRKLNVGSHYNTQLQRDWEEYTSDSFIFSVEMCVEYDSRVLEETIKMVLFYYEDKIMRNYKSTYNILQGFEYISNHNVCSISTRALTVIKDLRDTNNLIEVGSFVKILGSKINVDSESETTFKTGFNHSTPITTLLKINNIKSNYKKSIEKLIEVGVLNDKYEVLIEGIVYKHTYTTGKQSFRVINKNISKFLDLLNK